MNKFGFEWSFALIEIPTACVCGGRSICEPAEAPIAHCVEMKYWPHEVTFGKLSPYEYRHTHWIVLTGEYLKTKHASSQVYSCVVVFAADTLKELERVKQERDNLARALITVSANANMSTYS